jgi:hypothetical protein
MARLSKVHLLLMLLPALFVATAPAVPAAVTTQAPLAPYPTALPLPAGDSVLPTFVDDDELVRAQLRRDGTVAGITDDLKIKINGSGDYALRLPGSVLDVADQGGDSVPGLDGGKVSFLGHLSGAAKLLAAEANLDPAAYAARIPIRVGITYTDSAAPGGRRTYVETLDIENRTGQPAQLMSGTPDRATLAQALEALRSVPSVYTPETDLSSLYPLPASLPLQGPVGVLTQPVFVPLAVDVKVQLESSSTLVGAGGADVATDSRGTRLHWVARLPTNTATDGSLKLIIVFTGASPLRVPAVDIRSQVLPLPAAVFAPPGGGGWAGALRTAPNLPDLAVLAQAGALSLHRIGDQPPLVSRPGPGPERVAFELVLPSGQASHPKPPVDPPLHPQIWAVVLALLVTALLAANAYWAWSRH